MTQEEKIQEIKRLAAQKGVTEEQLQELAAKQKKFDPNRFLDNMINVLDTLKNVEKGVGGTLTDKEGNLIGIKDKDGRPDQRIKILGMSPPVFFLVGTAFLLVAGYAVVKYMRK